MNGIQSRLVHEIQRNHQPLVKFFYNDRGHRVRMETYHPNSGVLQFTDYYVRDVAGSVMAIYRKNSGATISQLVEHTIYGTGRLGIRKSDGSHLYQLTDHLGNVRAVVGRAPNGQEMSISNATDYYPFGMPMPGKEYRGRL